MKKQRGRPPLKPTATQRQRVRIAAGAGVAHFEIAAALGVSQPTLRKHFAAELHEGAALARVEVAVALHGAALRGSPSACRAFLALGAARLADPPPPKSKPKPPGKKELQAANAITAADGTDWADLLPAAGGPEVLQ